jgi:hypothetical protein
LSPAITLREEGLPGAAAGPGETPEGARSPNRRRRAATRMVRPAKDLFPVAVSSMTMDSSIHSPLSPKRYTLLRARQGGKRVSLDRGKGLAGNRDGLLLLLHHRSLLSVEV